MELEELLVNKIQNHYQKLIEKQELTTLHLGLVDLTTGETIPPPTNPSKYHIDQESAIQALRHSTDMHAAALTLTELIDLHEAINGTSETLTQIKQSAKNLTTGYNTFYQGIMRAFTTQNTQQS